MLDMERMVQEEKELSETVITIDELYKEILEVKSLIATLFTGTEETEETETEETETEETETEETETEEKEE